MRILKILFVLILLPCIAMSQDVKKVLIIGIDGCRSDALELAETPHIDSLRSIGIYSRDALNDDITISGPGWSAILCGVGSEKHLVTGNNFTLNNYEDFPPFLKYVEIFNPDLHSVSICHWAPINDFIVQDFADFKLNVSSDLEVASQAADYLEVNDPDVMFLHFDDVDHAGHTTGFSPLNDEYLASIESVDSYVGTVLKALEERSTFLTEDWLVLLTTDHGGLGTSHGGNSMEEQQIFMIASGKNVTPGLISRDSTIIDQSVLNCLGDSIELHFEGSDDNVQIPQNPLFDFGTSDDFTIECRVRTDQAGDVAIIGNKDWSSGANKGFVFSFKYPSGPEWKVNIGDGVNRADINSGGEIADNQWHNLSVSFDRDGFMKMYQDGMLLDSVDISNVGDINADAGFFFGTDVEGDFGFSGAISEVRIWSGVLPFESINDWHCKSIENSHPEIDQLLANWKLNEGVGNEIVDYSTNEINGIVQGAEWSLPDSVLVLYNYDNTPRLTDVVPTVFAHLCIPIDETWGLDGTSLIVDCLPTGVKSQGPSTLGINFEISPNPSNDLLKVRLLSDIDFGLINVDIHNSKGEKIIKMQASEPEFEIDISAFNSGIYYITLSENERYVSKKFIKI